MNAFKTFCSKRDPKYLGEIKSGRIIDAVVQVANEAVDENKGDRELAMMVLDTYMSKPAPYIDTVTITYGEVAENHPGMQKLGHISNTGFEMDELRQIKKSFNGVGVYCELISLNKFVDEKTDEAGVLVIRKGADYFLSKAGKTPNDMYKEQKSLKWDSKALMRGQVKNKNARHNLCYGSEQQSPNYEKGQGTIVKFEDVPLLDYVRKHLPDMCGIKSKELNAEGNLYYNLKKCGIGFHGDAERKRVIGLRLGGSMTLHYQWFHRFKPEGDRCVIKLNHGDMYIMSEKASGYDWRKSSIYTLRHAAGCPKYTTIK